jgi:hypothetical protein
MANIPFAQGERRIAWVYAPYGQYPVRSERETYSVGFTRRMANIPFAQGGRL